VSFVLDASFALTWCFDDETTGRADQVLRDLRSDYSLVPAIWPLEIANGLVVAERRGRIDAAIRDEFLGLLMTIDIRVETVDVVHTFAVVLDLARREGLTSYDAAYLDLALRERLPLATRDAALAEAARRVGVSLIPA
jgi:predicted nucleic acid-binding protein